MIVFRAFPENPGTSSNVVSRIRQLLVTLLSLSPYRMLLLQVGIQLQVRVVRFARSETNFLVIRRDR